MCSYIPTGMLLGMRTTTTLSDSLMREVRVLAESSNRTRWDLREDGAVRSGAAHD